VSLSTKLIEGTKPEAETLAELQKKMSLPAGKSITLMVFETSFKDKKVYCCWSGGAIKDGEPQLTLVGKAALEALVNLPLGSTEALIFQELKQGPTLLKDKVRAAIMRAPEGAKICFVGDMQGELDGHMHKAFNLAQGTIKISH